MNRHSLCANQPDEYQAGQKKGADALVDRELDN
jgi:hypothetical protein